MSTHTVTSGECILSIAEDTGFFWETIWLHGDNADLRAKRKEPNLLAPGDQVVIPDKGAGREQGSDGKKHRFRRKGIPAKLRLVLERNDLPIADTDFVLVVDGTTIEGKTDADGLLDVVVPANAQKADLTIAELHYELTLGGLDPVEEVSGVQDRLQNLGFYHGAIDGDAGEQTQAAIREFRAFKGLPEGDGIDQELRDALVERQDRMHDSEAELVDDDEDEACSDVDAIDEQDDEDDEFGPEPDDDVDIRAADDAPAAAEPTGADDDFPDDEDDRG